MFTYATTDNESQAAAIAVRLISEGRDATTRDVADLLADGYPIRSSFKYAVMVIEPDDRKKPS